VTDHARDALLTDFGKATLDDRYLLPGETYQDMFARVADAYADDQTTPSALRLHLALWFMPATPVLSNGGTGRGLPISCYLNSVDDSLDGIVGTWNENVWLPRAAAASAPTGATCAASASRSASTARPAGIIPFVRVMDSLTLAISRARCGAARPPAISTSTTRRSRSSSKSASRRATSTARR
jgi:ribonucleoside-diphosphate reductase alpha chain